MKEAGLLIHSVAFSINYYTKKAQEVANLMYLVYKAGTKRKQLIKKRTKNRPCTIGKYKILWFIV
jgi:hypothetical protein